MVKRWLVAALALLLFSASASAQDARATVDEVSRVMGVVGLDSIAYTGTAAVGNFGQSRTISFGLASTTIRNYARAIDFTRPASHVTGYAAPPQVQGGPPPGDFEQVTAATSGWDGLFEIWTTPWGFLRGAATNGATVRSQKVDGVPFKVITWVPPQKAPSGQPYRVAGYVNGQNLVERVETWVEHPIFGDMHVELTYSDYHDVGGLKVPARMSEKRVGMETFVLVITAVRPNPAGIADLLLPLAGERARADAAADLGAKGVTPVTSEKLAEGVYRIIGDYAALAVELRDTLVVLGGGASCGGELCAPAAADRRAQEILAEARRVVPGKPIKYVVNLHPHFDHASVLPAFAAEGITILTDDPNRYFLEQALGSPRTLVGDALGRSRRKPKVVGVEEKMVLGDGTRSIELHHLVRFEHSDGMLVAYLPREKLLFTSDIDVPPQGQPPGPGVVALLQNLERLQIDFARHVMVRPPEPERPMSRAELAALVRGAKR